MVTLVLGGVIGVVVALWFLFRGPQFAVLYSDLPLEASAAVVAELEAENVDFRLSEGGTKIEVPHKDIDRLRVALSASNGVLTGTDGFELFNQSEMGLTEFTQRIKFQRALQGELARTVMAMDDVREARVHLTLPERNLFRADRTSGKAAVTIRTDSGSRPNETMVLGIQQLIAASVPDLAPENVVVLSARGEPVSAIAPVPAVIDGAVGLGQVSNEFASRIHREIVAILPSLSIELQAEAQKLDHEKEPAKDATRITVRLLASDKISQDQRDQIAEAVNKLVQTEGYAGADLFYVSAPLSPLLPNYSDTGSASPAPITQSKAQGQLDNFVTRTFWDWLIGPNGRVAAATAFGVLVLALVGLALSSPRRKKQLADSNDEDLEAAQALRVALAGQRDRREAMASSSKTWGTSNAP